MINVKAVTITYIPCYTISDSIKNKNVDEDILNNLNDLDNLDKNYLSNKDITIYQTTIYLNLNIPNNLLYMLIEKDINKNILGIYNLKKIQISDIAVNKETYETERNKYNVILLSKTPANLEKNIAKNIELKFKSDNYYYNLNSFMNAKEFISKCLKNVNKQLYYKNKQFEKYFQLYHSKVKFYKKNHEYRLKVEEKLQKLNEERMKLIDIKEDLKHLASYYKNKEYISKIENDIKEKENTLQNINKIKELKKDIRFGKMIDINEKEIEKFEKQINISLQKRKQAYEERRKRELEQINKKLDEKTKEYLKNKILTKGKQKELER